MLRVTFVLHASCSYVTYVIRLLNPLNAELNPIWHPLALVGAHHIFHVSRIRVNCLPNSVAELWETATLLELHLGKYPSRSQVEAGGFRYIFGLFSL